MVFERAPISKTYARDVTPGTCDVAGGSAGTKARVLGLAGILVAVSTSLLVGPALLSGSPAATGVPSPPHKPHGGAVPFTPSLGEPESPAAWPRPGHDPDIRRAAPSVDIEAHFSGWSDDDAAPPAPHTPHGSAMARDTAPQSPKSSRRGAAAAALWPRPGQEPEVRTAVPTDDDEAPPSGTHANDNLPPAPHILRGSAVLLATAPEAPEPARGGIAAAAHGPRPGRDLEVRPEVPSGNIEGLTSLYSVTANNGEELNAGANDDEQLKALAAHLPEGLTSLVIDLQHSYGRGYITDEGLKALAAHLPGGLTSLDVNLRSTKVADEGLKALAAHLPGGLTSLGIDLDWTKVGDEGLKALAAHLPGGLTSLDIDLRDTQVADEGVKALAAHLPGGLTSLDIDLQWAKVGDEGLKALAAHLPGGLTSLDIDLRCTKLGDEGLKALTAHRPEGLTSFEIKTDRFFAFDKGLEGLSGLHYVHATSDERLKALAAHFPEGLTSLVIDSSFTKVTDEGLKALAARFPEGLSRLYINLEMTYVADEGLKALFAHLPEGLTSLYMSLWNTNVAGECFKALACSEGSRNLRNFTINLVRTKITNDTASDLGKAVLRMKGLHELHIFFENTALYDNANGLPLSRDKLHRSPIKYCSAGSLAEHFYIAAGGKPSVIEQVKLVVGAKGTWLAFGIAMASATVIIAAKHTLCRNLVNEEGPHIGYQMAAREATFRKQHGWCNAVHAHVYNIADTVVLVFMWGPFAYFCRVGVVVAIYAFLFALPAILSYGAGPVFRDPTLSLATHTERHTTRLLFAVRGFAVLIAGDLISGDWRWLRNPYFFDIVDDKIDTHHIFSLGLLSVICAMLIVCSCRLLSAVVQLACALIRGCVALIRGGVHSGEEQAEARLLEGAAAESVSNQGAAMAGNVSAEALLLDGAPADSAVPLANATAGDFNMEDKAQELARSILNDVESVEFDKFGWGTFFITIIPVLLDVVFDLITIFSMFRTENYWFGGILLTVWTVTIFEETSRGPLLRIVSEVRESFKTKVTSKLLTEMLLRESGFEAFVSLALTSYAVPFCFQSNTSMLLGFASMLLSVKSIAKHLHIRLDLKMGVD